MTIEAIWPPAIPFVRPKGKKQDKKSKTTDAGDDNNKDDDDNDVKVRGFKIKLIPGDKNVKDTYMVKQRVFEDGTPKDWCEWRVEVTQLLANCGYTTPSTQLAAYWGLLMRRAWKPSLSSTTKE